MSPIRFLIVPDKFKGSLSAEEAGQAIAQGIRTVLPSAKIKIIPLADGGDGTAMLLGKALHARMINTQVHGPLGKKVRASWGLLRSTAYLDFASASGLNLVPEKLRNPLKTSSRGVGELMKEAVNRGAHHLVLGVGGSATIDGGIGAMRALGIRFLNHRGKNISEGGKGLLELRRVELDPCLWQGKKICITILADVKNPLLGENGAATVFGPQKGATPTMARQLTQGLNFLNRVILQHHHQSLASTAFGGAAGGVTAGFLGLLGNVPSVTIHVVPGIDYVLDRLKVKSFMKKAHWIFTGEGQLDSQTIQGKTIEGITRLARKMHKPVIAFAGKVLLNKKEMKTLGLKSAFAVAPGPCTLQESLKHTRIWLTDTVARVVTLM